MPVTRAYTVKISSAQNAITASHISPACHQAQLLSSQNIIATISPGAGLSGSCQQPGPFVPSAARTSVPKIGNTQTMTDVPAPTVYHRLLGWHAPAMRRALAALTVGVIVVVVLLPFVTWAMALVAGWDAAAITVLLSIWPVIIRADSSLAPQLAAREDETEDSTRALLVGASVASLLGAGYALHLAGQHSGAPRVLLIVAAVVTVMLSWAVINSVYTLRYADQHFRSKPGGIEFGTEDGRQHPSYRDFAYVAFTIGMCYQVSDTTLRDPLIRRTALAHALLSYLFGVVIVAGSVNLISGLFR